MKESEALNVLFIADIVGKPGIDITSRYLTALLKKHNVDICIANGENATDGKGITDKEFFQFKQMGVDVVTGGNHIWDRQPGLEGLIPSRLFIEKIAGLEFAEEAKQIWPAPHVREMPGLGKVREHVGSFEIHVP
ncbi:MAG: YmdB family metallophosphoesterase, partial [bacterium]